MKKASKTPSLRTPTGQSKRGAQRARPRASAEESNKTSAPKPKLSAGKTVKRSQKPTASAATEVPSIGLDELLTRLADPTVPEAELIPYLTAERDPDCGLAPVLHPNENVRQDTRGAAQARARGDIGLGFLNHVFRDRRRRVFEERLVAKDPRPVLLAEGDSWFQYPIWLKDVVDQLESDYTVLCLSAAGDELRSMVAEAEYRDYLLRLSGQVSFRAMIFSAGGNDVVGPELKELLRQHDPALDAAGHIDGSRWAQKLGEILAGYEAMIAAVHGILPSMPILIHGYDHANPLPHQGFKVPPLDGWLGDPMRARSIPDGPLQLGIARVMIDGVNDALQTLAGGNRPGGRHPKVFFVDNRGAVAGRWHDELHPLDSGFAEVAGRFRAVLHEAGVP